MDASKLLALARNKKAALKVAGSTVKPSDGKTTIRILPGWRENDRETFFHDFGQHFIKNAGDEIQAVYLCVDRTYGKPCPVCEGISIASGSTADTAMKDVLKQASAVHRFLVNAIVISGGSDANLDRKKPAVFEIPKGVFDGILALVEEWGPDILDLEKGKNIIIERTGKAKNTKYTVSISPKGDPLPASILSQLNNLDDFVQQESSEKEQKALNAIRSVAGLLPPARTSTNDTPKTTSTRVATTNAAPIAAAAAVDPTNDELSSLDDLLND